MASQTLLRLGTRGSALALAQAAAARRILAALEGAGRLETVAVSTSGDKSRAPLWNIGGKGLFVKELEDALRRGRVDIAVHSLKDVPAVLPEGLVLAGCLRREDPRDALVSRGGKTLRALPGGARVGTSSPRREAQLRRLRPDLRVLPFRGSVPRRLEKIREGKVDAALLALAGLRRLGLQERVSEKISVRRMIPAAGQGIVALECRRGDDRALALLRRLRHAPTWTAMRAERAFLAAMQGDCRTPLAALARPRGELMRMDALAASLDGRRMLRVSAEGPADRPAALGRRAARMLLAKGAAALVAESLEAMRRP